MNLKKKIWLLLNAAFLSSAVFAGVNITVIHSNDVVDFEVLNSNYANLKLGVEDNQAATQSMTIAIGALIVATQQQGVAISALNAATQAQTIAIGALIVATQQQGVAISALNAATQAQGIAIGNLNAATQAQNVAIGNLQGATQAQNTAIGNLNAATQYLNAACGNLLTNVAFFAYLKNNFYVSNATPIVLVYDGTNYNYGNCWNGTVFTAPISGIYSITQRGTSTRPGGVTAGTMKSYITKNTEDYIQCDWWPDPIYFSYPQNQLAVDVFLTNNETVSLSLVGTAGKTAILLGTNPCILNFFQMHLKTRIP